MQRLGAFLTRAKARRVWLRERGLVTLAAALVVEVSAATAGTRPAFVGLLRALGLVGLLLGLVLLGLLDAALSSAATRLQAAGTAAAGRVRGAIVPAPLDAPIPDELLLGRSGRPLRGAARAARLAAIARQREREARARTIPARLDALVARLRVRTRPYAARIAALLSRGRPYLRRVASLLSPAGTYLERTASVLRPYVGRARSSVIRASAGLRALAPAIPLPRLSLRAVRVTAIGLTLTFVFATVIGTTGLVASQGTVAIGASTTLGIISGEVTVLEPGASEFRQAADGEVLTTGMTIRTGGETYAVLTYFEGSTVSIDPATTLVIEALEAHPDGSTIIGMRQDVGRTWHAVTKLLTPGSRYEVRTPTATATVRGTLFLVGVQQGDLGDVLETVIETTEGAVAAERDPTPEAPEGEEIIVPAGFTVTAKPAEAIPPAVPAPEPERQVTVTVGAANSLVVDPQGRANGEKDGRIVVQTPGATVEKVDGKVVVTMPNIADGRVSTVVDAAALEEPADVEVVTVVSERGKGDVSSRATVRREREAPAVTGVEIRRGADADAPPEVRQLDQSEQPTPPAIKVADPVTPSATPATPPTDPPTGPAGGRSGDAGPQGAAGGTETTASALGIVRSIVDVTLPPLSARERERREEERRKADDKAREEGAKADEERRKEAEKHAEELRKAEEKAKEEAAKASEERRKAEGKAREETAKVAEERRGAEQRDRDAGQGDGDRDEDDDDGRDGRGVRGSGSFIERIVDAVTPRSQNDGEKRAEELRKESEKQAEERRKAEEKANEDAAKASEERRKAEEKAREEAIKAEENKRKEAEKRAEELRKAEEKAKEESAKRLEEVRKIEEKAREQAAKLAEEQRKESEKRLEEYRKAEEKKKQDEAKRLEEQRKAEEKAKEEAEKRLEALRKAEQKAKEEGRKRAEEEAKRLAEEKKERGGFVPSETLKPLPGAASRSSGGNKGGDGSRGESGSSDSDD